MKTTASIALILTLLTTSISAAPSLRARSNYVTVQLANDQSGANADVTVPADGNPRSIDALFGQTAVAQNGIVFATSTLLNAFQQDTVCTIVDQDGKTIAMLNAEETFAELDGGKVVDLEGAVLSCEDV